MSLLRILMIPFVLLVFAPAASAAPRVVVLDLRDTVQPASQRYLERGLRSAADAGAVLVVIELDTPGGLLESLRSMTSAILRSPVPVAVYVTPAGARAASAGFFLLIAADVAAMAPGTHTGAAHPVGIGQKDDDTSMAKATEDATALARSLAAGRDRPVAWAEKVVRESAAYTADEARARGLIDLIAIDRDALLRALDGTSIRRFDGSTHTLHLAGAEIASLDRTLAERVLTVIASPQIAYLLLTLGAICLLIELTSPGLIVPGIAGALALLMGLYGLSLVPVSLVGALLMAVGFGLLVAEVFVTSYGLLAIAGIVGFVLGSLMLVDTPIPELQIGLELVVPTAVALAGLTTVVLVRAVRAQRLRPQTGIEAMIGERGQLVAGITADHDGKVFVHGEYWTATAAQPLSEGATVRVEAVDGLRLRVALVAPRGESV